MSYNCLYFSSISEIILAVLYYYFVFLLWSWSNVHRKELFVFVTRPRPDVWEKRPDEYILIDIRNTWNYHISRINSNQLNIKNQKKAKFREQITLIYIIFITYFENSEIIIYVCSALVILECCVCHNYFL